MIEIKKITKDNLDILTAGFDDLIERQGPPNNTVSRPHLAKLVEDSRSYLFVALIGDKIVGYALAYSFPSLWSTYDLAYLYDIEVSPAYRNKGVGRLLIKTMLADLKAGGVIELWLGTATDNTAGQALFSSTGAEKSEEVFNDYTYILREQ